LRLSRDAGCDINQLLAGDRMGPSFRNLYESKIIILLDELMTDLKRGFFSEVKQKPVDRYVPEMF
jgi:hypothetical protein